GTVGAEPAGSPRQHHQHDGLSVVARRLRGACHAHTTVANGGEWAFVCLRLAILCICPCPAPLPRLSLQLFAMARPIQ
ncbi:MAG: hypothetical protein RSH52_27560, partial [Janthinobacterium sp.]